MTSRPTPRLATGLLAGALTFALAPAALAGQAQVSGTTLQITAAANETNIITVERLPNESIADPTGTATSREVIIVRDATNPTTAPVPGLPDQIGAILTPGVGCTPFADENSAPGRTALKCTAPDFQKIDADLSTTADQTAEANEPQRDADFFSEVDTDGKTYDGTPATENVLLPPADVTGGAGKDVLRGTANADVLDAGSANDQIFGLAGNDQVAPGGGQNDPVAGGPGSDTISYASSTVRVIVTLDGRANDGENARDNVLADVENVTTGSGDDLVIAPDSDSNNTIVTGAGNDEVQARGGDDRIEAGDGNNVVDAGDGNDSGTAGTGNDRFTLGAGDDTFNVGGGDNTVDAGDGKDTVDTLAGTDTLKGFGGDDTLNAGDGENTVSGGDGVDRITGGTGTDRVNGDGGNDFINAGAGDNFVEGGDGNDGTAAEPITTLGGNDEIDGGAGADFINAGDGGNVVKGGTEADSITSGSGVDRVLGGAGADTISTGGENDRVQGGEGADVMDLGAGTGDLVDYLDRSAAVAAFLDPAKLSGEGCFSAGSCEGDKISNTENLTGGDGSDLLEGNTSANALTGGKGDVDNDPATTDGDDDLRGLTGSDELTGGDGYDRVSYSERVNGVTVTLDGQPGDGESGENDNVKGDIERVEGGSGGDSLTGSDQRNDLIGNAGNDNLNGKLGPDLLDGGAGTEDLVSYDGRDAGVTVDTDEAADDGQAGEGDNVLNSVENLTGGKGADRLTTNDPAGATANFPANELRGGEGNDVLDGGRGADDFFGGADRDQVAYTGRPSDETVVFEGDGVRNDGTGVTSVSTAEGNCTVDAPTVSAERDLINEDVEGIVGGLERNVFIATGSSIQAGDFVAGGGNDVLVGGPRADLLQGGAGDDVICGGADNDVLVGGTGSDVLNGQADEDRVVDREAGDTVFAVEGFGGDASLPAFAQPAPAPQQATTSSASTTTEQQPASSGTSTTQQPASSGTSTTQQPASSGTSTTQQPATSGGTTSGGTTSGGTTSGSTQETVRVVPVGEVAGSTTQGQRSLQSIRTTKSGSKTVARVRGTVADRSCKRGQTITVKVLAGRKVVGTKAAKLGKGCTFNVLVPVKTSAKTVTATVSMAGTKNLRTR